MSCTVDYSTLYKCDSFLHSQKFNSKTTIACQQKGEGHTDENYFEIGQREFRKIPVKKKISFKIKKSSTSYRRNIDGHKKFCINSNHVAQLTQKFNDIVAENNSANGDTNIQLGAKVKNTKNVNSEVYKTHQIHNTKHIKLYRKPSLDNKALVIIKTKPVSKENSIKKQISLLVNNNVPHRTSSAKTSTKQAAQTCSEKPLPDNENNVKFRMSPQNNNNMVQAKIEIFERKSTLNEPNTKRLSNAAPKIDAARHNPKTSTSLIALETSEDTKNKDQTGTNQVPNQEIIHIKCPRRLNLSTLDRSKSVFSENEKEVFISEKVHIPQRNCESMYETITPVNTLDSYKSKSYGGITNLDIPIKPNNSFLWSDKSPTNCYSTIKPNRRSEVEEIFYNHMINNQTAPELPPKPNFSPKIVETYNPQYERLASEIQVRKEKSLERNCPTLENVDEGYELFSNDDCIEENIYEAMSSPNTEITSLKLHSNNSNDASENEDTKSNFYEKIYNRNAKKEEDNESIYESVYESNISCSNRHSLTSEQNSNSLYGKNLWEQEDDRSTYKAISDISDEWVDVSDNEEEEYVSSGVIIIHEKQRSKKSSWSQHLRGQWAKSDPPLSVTADSDSDHHYESLYTTYEQQDDDYDSFESDSESEKSVGKTKSNESFIYMQNNQLPKPPNAQPYGLIKFAGKHMKKLKNNFSLDLSKSLSRMTKRISRTDLNSPNSVKEEKLQTLPSNKVTESPSLRIQEASISSTSTNGAISHNIEYSKALPPKPSDEKERISFLKKIRRSMSMSTESALELTSNLANKRRSTFYLTETIDIDKNENDVTLVDHSMISSRLSKPNVLRPRSPPPPAPVKGSEQNKDTSDGKISEGDELKNNNNTENQTTFWYAEVGLYQSSLNTPSTSTAENSGSNISYTIKSSDSINQEVEDYYNMKNNNEYNIEETDKVDEAESNENESFTNVTPDIQLLLQDEPLYQFYDAAVLESVCRDGVSDIDSDTYEEIDDNISEVSSNRPSAMELVLPNRDTISFTKTLWCEIPEVMQSAVLGKLSGRQKKLQEAKFEMITSEASYLNSLNVLHDHFATNIRQYVSEKEWEILFGKVIAVRACSDRMLQELEKCWQDNILLYGICDIVQKETEENFYVYIHYCENQILLGDTLKQVMKKPGFIEFLKELESSASCQFLTLYSFLMLPMQRITRWPLLVDAVLKRLSQSDPEYLVCQYALSSLNKIVNQCNEAARRKEREIELQNISRNLEFAKDVVPVDIILPDRWLIRSGSVTNIQPKNDDSKMTFGKRFNKVQLYLYLFNDLFLVTKEKSCGTYTILHYCPRNLVELNDTEVLLFAKKDYPEKNLLFLTILENQEGKTVEFLLSCAKESDKERWIEAINPPKSEDPDETLYECWDCPQVTAVHNYNGIQPDELSLGRGDVINVLRKMADGWYHGERIRDGQTGWFPANYTSEIVNPHVRARNLKQRYRLLAFSENYLKSN